MPAKLLTIHPLTKLAIQYTYCNVNYRGNKELEQGIGHVAELGGYFAEAPVVNTDEQEQGDDDDMYHMPDEHHPVGSIFSEG